MGCLPLTLATLPVLSVIGQESTVINPLGSYPHGCTSLAGATISGDGQVRLDFDPIGLLEKVQSASAGVGRATA